MTGGCLIAFCRFDRPVNSNAEENEMTRREELDALAKTKPGQEQLKEIWFNVMGVPRDRRDVALISQTSYPLMIEKILASENKR